MTKHSRHPESNRLFQVWLSKETFEAMQAFLDKFSAGESLADQARNFLDWLRKQTEGIDHTKLALQLRARHRQT